MGDYYDHYLKKGVLLLADVFEKFIVQIRSLSLFSFSWIKLGCDVKSDWCKVRKNIKH